MGLRVVWLPARLRDDACGIPSSADSQLSALVPRFFKGGELPDAAVLQQWLNVLITALFRGVGQVATDAAAVFLNPTRFMVFRDE